MTATQDRPPPPDRSGTPIPMLDGGLPLAGHAFEFRRDPVRFLQRGRDQLGDIFSFRLFHMRAHVLSSASGIQAFFRAPDRVLSFREAQQWTVPVIGKGVAYDLEPELMEQQLRPFHSALRDEKMQSYTRIIAAEIGASLDRWGERGEIDLLGAINDMIISAVAACTVGTRDPLAAEFIRLYDDIKGWMSVSMIGMVAPNLPLRMLRKRKQARARLVEVIAELIARRRASPVQNDDFLQALIEARDAEGRPLADRIVIGMLLAFLMAGQYTSAAYATWTGVLLLRSAEQLALVKQEQDAVLGQSAVTLAAVKQLARLEACMKEAERLYPPLVALMRKVMVRFEFDGYAIPPGDWVVVSPAVSHRNPAVFADPAQYDPARFLPGREEDRRTANALIGFGAGRHHCLGQAFAQLLAKVIWTLLIRRFDLSLLDPLPERNYATFVVGPRAPCRIAYRRRTPG